MTNAAPPLSFSFAGFVSVPSSFPLLRQIAILMGCAVLPHLRQMVEIVEHGLVDEQQKVRAMVHYFCPWYM